MALSMLSAHHEAQWLTWLAAMMCGRTAVSCCMAAHENFIAPEARSRSTLALIVSTVTLSLLLFEVHGLPQQCISLSIALLCCAAVERIVAFTFDALGARSVQ